MLSYNEVKPGVAVLIEGEPYVCTWNNIMQKQQRYGQSDQDASSYQRQFYRALLPAERQTDRS